jgi:hypothetical protein
MIGKRLAVAAVAATLVWSATADARNVGSGTFAAPLGPIDWTWSVRVKHWAGRDWKVYQEIHWTAPFENLPQTELADDTVPTSHRRLDIQTRKTSAPVIQAQTYPYDTQALVAWPTNLSGIVTLANVRALKLHYVYTDTQPVSPGTTDLQLTQPTSRHTLHNTRLKFWLAGANGGGNGFVYDLQTVEGKVRICRRDHCRWYWKLIYKWPPWSKIAPLGRLTPAQP